MPSKLRLPSPAMIVALISLFVALSGGAYAVTAKKNSVKSSSIKNGQVLNPDIGNGAVTKPKLGADVNSAFLPAGAASSFAPSSSVRKIAFNPTSCGGFSGVEPCFVDLASFNDIRLSAECYVQTGVRYLNVVLSTPGSSSFSTNVAVLRDGQPATVTPLVGTGFVLNLNGTDNVVGTMVIEIGGTSKMITIPFHAYVGAGTAPNTAACVFEGTATTA